MRVALAALYFKNGDIEYNLNAVSKALAKLEGQADFVIFGETFIQGFEGVTWDYEKDRPNMLTLDDPRLAYIQSLAKEHHLAVCIGLFENYQGHYYDTQVTMDQEGNIINVYRRISASWKEKFVTDKRYAEGDSFSSFELLGKTFMVAICGDLWYDDILQKALQIPSDYLIWPVYLDYSADTWNKEEKFAYAKQAALLSRPTLLVNSLAIDKDEISYYSKGGACYFNNGEIGHEIPSGNERILIVEIS